MGCNTHVTAADKYRLMTTEFEHITASGISEVVGCDNGGAMT